MSTEALSRVILSWPTVVNLKDAAGAAPRSWIQLARTGSFVSKRYGSFAITRADLAQMFHNFNEVTPKAPTELPIDYDHLSMDPKQPGDGVAAGWMKGLELRANGDELWAQVEWTPEGAKRIENREYRFISPSFIKDHTHKDGTKIGTTLLAAALTSHPFLEGLAAVTLNTPAVAAMHLSAALRDLVAVEDGVISLSEVGQRVMIAPGHARTQDEVGGTFEISEVVGQGDDAFVTLKDANGVPHKWFRASELLPASATPAQPVQPNLAPGQKKEQQMSTTKDAGQTILARAQQLVADGRLDLSAAVKRAAAEDGAGAAAYLEQFNAAPERPEPTVPPVVINLHRRPDEGFVELVGRVQRERRIDLRDAIRVVSQAHPDLAEAHERGETL